MLEAMNSYFRRLLEYLQWIFNHLYNIFCTQIRKAFSSTRKDDLWQAMRYENHEKNSILAFFWRIRCVFYYNKGCKQVYNYYY